MQEPRKQPIQYSPFKDKAVTIQNENYAYNENSNYKNSSIYSNNTVHTDNEFVNSATKIKPRGESLKQKVQLKGKGEKQKNELNSLNFRKS